MQPLAADLRAGDMRGIAEFYAGLAAPQEQKQANSPDAASVERGRRLAVEGLPNAGVPPCVTCHNGAGSYPHLGGQHAAYMAQQLRLRKAGAGPSTESAAIMAPLAQRLSNEDIDAVSNYFGSQ
jgi:cytochrome c553